MKKIFNLKNVILLSLFLLLPKSSFSQQDWRNLKYGNIIPDEGYCDQPYVVITNDNNWLCVLTTGKGRESQKGQHVISTISTDKGQTWSKPVDIEPADGPEASWVIPLKVPSGRIYAIYNYNYENLREIKLADGGTKDKVTMIGKLMFKYSDDNGRTWSKQRYEIPIRTTEIDRKNVYKGKKKFFWSVSKPIIDRGAAYFGFTKIGNYRKDFNFEGAGSEGYFFKSMNILTESDPTAIEWQLLPNRDIGLRAKKGPIAQEHNLVALSDGSLYCTYRTLEGHPMHTYSRDGGESWSQPDYMTYIPEGKRVKHPIAANFVRKFSNGKFLYWFHNNSTIGFSKPNWREHGVGNRNIAWLCGGIEKEGFIHWSQPEILLYADDLSRGPSYPDFIEDGDEFYITETQKTVAKVHQIDKNLLNHLWNQFEINTVAQDGLVLNLTGDECHKNAVHKITLVQNRYFKK